MLRPVLRTILIVAVLTGLAAYATITWRGPKGVAALQEKRREIHGLEVQNANLARDNEAERQRIEKLKHDPDTQKLEIEKRLGLLPQHATRYQTSGVPSGQAPGNGRLATPSR